MGQLRSVVFGQGVVFDEALGHHAGQLGHFAFDALDPVAADHQRWQVRVRKVAVVGGVFLGAHGAGFARVGVEQHGGLLDGVAVFDLVDLPTHFVVDGLLHELEAVQVLDLAACAQLATGLAHRHVGITPEAAFLHVAVANADPGDDFVQFFGVGHGLFAAAHVGLGHDFQQRGACAVQVNARLAPAISDGRSQARVFVQRLARVFFEVGTLQAHGFANGLFAHFQEERHLAALHYGDLKLADLVALGQVGVEVVFARKNAALGDVRVDGQAEFDGSFYGADVHHGQRAGQGHVHRTSLRVGLGTKRYRGTAEDLALGRELGVCFEADDDFVALDEFAHGVQTPAGFCRWKSVACCRRCAALSSWASLK